MVNNNHASDVKQKNQTRNGVANIVNGTGNVTQTVSVSSPKSGKIAGVVVPIIAALISALAGSYATHHFAVSHAPEQTTDKIETILGIARGAIDIAKSSQSSPVLISKLGELISQAEAVQANIQLLQTPPSGVALQADFWLPMHRGALLGESTSFGINGSDTASSLSVHLNDKSLFVKAGMRIPYKTKSGKSCYVIYVGPSPDNKLYGFKITCE